MKRAVLEAITILVISLTLALTVNGLRSKGIRLVRVKPPPAAEITPESKTVISFGAAVEKFNARQAVFIDARSSADYRAGHIPGALNLPTRQFDEWIDDFFTATDPAQELIAYCHGADCPLAKELVELLSDAGFDNVSYVEDGWGKWMARGLPEETGNPD